MKTLKEKWSDALTVIWGIISIFILIGLFIFGMVRFANWVSEPSKPDPRTIEEVKSERYKQCLEYSNSMSVQNCDNYLLPVPNTQ